MPAPVGCVRRYAGKPGSEAWQQMVACTGQFVRLHRRSRNRGSPERGVGTIPIRRSLRDPRHTHWTVNRKPAWILDGTRME